MYVRDIAPYGVRMPAELKERLQARAKRNGRSMNSEIVQILQDVMDAEDSDAENSVLTAQVMENRETLPDEYQKILANFDQRIKEIAEQATKEAIIKAAIEANIELDKLTKKPT